MSLMEMLKQYANVTPGQAVPAAQDHFHEAAQSAPPDVLAQGIAAAMRSDQTPPFGQMVGQMYQHAEPTQQAGMLNKLIAGLAPGGLAALAGGALGRFLPTSGPMPPITPEQASQLSPQQVQDVADHAEKQNPTIIDRMGDFYAQHPGLVKTLGGAALTIALAKIAGNMRQR